jgi:hypothetical protein
MSGLYETVHTIAMAGEDAVIPHKIALPARPVNAKKDKTSGKFCRLGHDFLPLRGGAAGGGRCLLAARPRGRQMGATF